VSVELSTIFNVVSFAVLLLIGLPIAWVTGATAVIFAFVILEPMVLIVVVGRIFSSIMTNYSIITIPLYVLMGDLLQRSGVAEQLYQAIYVWSGKLRGGMAVATIIGCTLMAAMVGVVGAEIVTFGLLALPAMLERN
jgi:TRAP-type mannitol/chloroaromatic compound transport system permease large subunit